VVAQKPAADKSGYHLFHPTPKELMREMATDRPDKTESAYSLDAGHFQLEMDVLTYGFDRYDTDFSTESRSHTWSVAPINLKMGLLNNVDLQVIVDNFTHTSSGNRAWDPDREEDVETRERTSGFGDITTRLKVNLLGNDGGQGAIAVMPFIKAPTSSSDLGNRYVEGGVLFPYAVEMPEGWSVGGQVQYDFVRNTEKSRYDSVFSTTVSFGHDIIGDLAGYIEFYAAVSSDTKSDWEGTVDVGFTYAFTPDIQLDWGCNFGVTRAAADYNPFLGLSYRY
jgi:hypothetical protein